MSVRLFVCSPTLLQTLESLHLAIFRLSVVIVQSKRKKPVEDQVDAADASVGKFVCSRPCGCGR